MKERKMDLDDLDRPALIERVRKAEKERAAAIEALRRSTEQEHSMAWRMRAAVVEARRRLAKGRALWNGPCHECDGVLALALSADCPVIKGEAENRAEAAEKERDRLQALINSPELLDFGNGVRLEAVHQRERWGAAHDAGKAPEDWFWLLGYLGGKALHAAKAGDAGKALHHTISSAAALANWHAALLGASNGMRPGIDPKERGYDAA